MAKQPPARRDGLIYAAGSALFSGLIAAALGTVIQTNPTTWVAMIALAMIGGGMAGYRGRMNDR